LFFWSVSYSTAENSKFKVFANKKFELSVARVEPRIRAHFLLSGRCVVAARCCHHIIIAHSCSFLFFVVAVVAGKLSRVESSLRRLTWQEREREKDCRHHCRDCCWSANDGSDDVAFIRIGLV
jgi:hypothetical protein